MWDGVELVGIFLGVVFRHGGYEDVICDVEPEVALVRRRDQTYETSRALPENTGLKAKRSELSGLCEASIAATMWLTFRELSGSVA